MTQAKQGDTVKVHYTGKLNDGSIFDSSEGREALEFTLGSQMVIPGFDAGVEGMKVGESKTVKIPCDQAYGPHHKEMVIDVTKTQLPADLAMEVGQELVLQHEDGGMMQVIISEVHDDFVKIDVNHPLAGKDLTFEIKLIEILG